MKKGEEKQLLPTQNAGAGGQRAEFLFIQGFRFVAMAWIITFHYLYYEPVKNTWMGRLIIGRPLDLFTVISGFVTHLAYGRRESIGGPFHFLCRRASKLAFMYYATTLVALILHTIAKCVQGFSPMALFMHLNLNVLPSLLGLNAWFSIIFPFFPEGESTIPNFLFPIAENTFPVNGALWYIQALGFCWFAYPLVRGWLFPSVEGSRVQKWAIAFLLWFFAVLPGALCLFADAQQPYWLFLKVFPPFMLPSFLLGAAMYDLWEQEVQEAREARERRQREGEGGTGWHGTAGMMGELLFIVIIIAIATLPLPNLLRYHVWSLAFALVVLLLAVASASPPSSSSTSLGLTSLLQSDAIVLLGDLSLVAYTMQSPLSTLFYWAVGGGIHDPHWIHVHWMGPGTFVVFVVALYGLALVVSKWVDRPATAWLARNIAEATDNIKAW
mmetsp:Transcript_67002/g.139641  ORF Transcript_67002/g.139641 Transcript_67002/m.139641 type:complete len:441 (+) Transcript_67002:86-1408(+)